MSEEANAIIAKNVVDLIAQTLPEHHTVQALGTPLRYGIYVDGLSVYIRVRQPVSEVAGFHVVKEDAQTRIVVWSNNSHSRGFTVRKDGSFPLKKILKAVEDAFAKERELRDAWSRCVSIQRTRDGEIQALNSRFSLPGKEGEHPAFLKAGDDYDTIAVIFPNLTVDQARVLLANADKLGLLAPTTIPDEVKRPSQWERLKAACPISEPPEED